MNVKNASLLLVDDDPTVLGYMCNILEEQYRITCSENAADALVIASSDNQPDIILMDVNLPDMSGYDVCNALKNIDVTRDIPVILVSGRNEDVDFAYGFDMGAVDFVPKPINSTVLSVRVRNHVRLLRKTQALKALAHTDPLTKIANRRRYNEALIEEWRRSMRSKSAMSLIIIDIDDFKLYNDNFGHGKGDDVLVQFGEILRYCCKRNSDLPARVGGEEFVALLPDTDEQGAKQIIEKIMKELQDAAIPHPYSTVSDVITVSCGIVTDYPVKGEVPESMFSRADQALYRAKNNGKNRFLFCDNNNEVAQ